MKNYQLYILNKWGKEEHCFFVQSNKSEEEIMADYRQAIDVLYDKGYHLYIQERTFGTTLPSLQDMLEVLGEAEDDDCEHNKHQHDHGVVGLLPLGEGVQHANHAQQGEQHHAELAQAHTGALDLCGGVGHSSQVEGVQDEGSQQHHQGDELRILLQSYQLLTDKVLEAAGLLCLFAHASASILMALVVSLSK